MLAQSKSKRVAKLLISVCYLAGCRVWDVALLAIGRKPHPQCMILYYHAIPPEQRNRFARQLDMLRSLTTPIGADADPLQVRGCKYSCVTFDDGFQSVLDNAVPELDKRGIPATLFITAGALGKCAGWWPESARYERQDRLLSPEQIASLPDLVTVGSHTLTHPKLPQLCESEARWELEESRRVLQELLKRKVTSFSFPFGAFNELLIEWCRQAGYTRVFTSMPLNALSSSTAFVMGRVPVEPTDWWLEFRLKVLGAYCWLPHAFLIKRWLLSNSIVIKARHLNRRLTASAERNRA